MLGALMLGAGALGSPGPGLAGEPLRLADGRPWVAVYYFGHWWEPWMSDDDAIRRDFRQLREMGVSVLGLDHEWSQAVVNDWGLLDREHRLAQEAGLQIIPWLSLKVWSHLSLDVATAKEVVDTQANSRKSAELEPVGVGSESNLS